MHVKIETATVIDGKRKEAGSVIDVPAEIYEKNSTWMKATDEPIKDAAAAKAGKSDTE